MTASRLNGVRVWFRGWRQRPGATLVTVAALAIALAANIVAFSLVRSLLLRPYPFRDLGSLVLLRRRVRATRPASRGWCPLMSPTSDVRACRSMNCPCPGYAELTLTGDGDAERVRSAFVSENLFRMLGATAAFGRALDDADTSADTVAVLSEGLWRRRFGGRPDALGRDIVLDGRAHRIVGDHAGRVQLPSWLRTLAAAGAPTPRGARTRTGVVVRRREAVRRCRRGSGAGGVGPVLPVSGCALPRDASGP